MTKNTQNFPVVEEVKFQPRGFRTFGWQHTESEIGITVQVGEKNIKALLGLDINIPEDGEVKFSCPHACSFCFNDTVKPGVFMTYQDVINVVEQGIKLGLNRVKFLGPGEFLTNPKIFEILDWFQNHNITFMIFTKGAVLGSDAMAQKYHGMGSQEFANKLLAYDNISFSIDARSFIPENANKNTPTRDANMRDKFNHHKARNKAIERICDAGFNKDPKKQRIMLGMSPILEDNIDEVLSIVKWGNRRNIPLTVTTTMISGKGARIFEKTQREMDFETRYIKLAIEIYKFQIMSGYLTLAELKKQGVSAYVGNAPCNMNHSLYIHFDGQVWHCPGNNNPEYIEVQDIRKTSLYDVWINSVNFNRTRYNDKCPAKDGRSIPADFYKTVLEGVESALG